MKFFRGLVGVQDTFFQALLTHNTNIFGLILDIVTETMPRDNLLNSACLELFEFIRRENIKPFVVHVVETYRERLLSITYVDTFHDLVNRYEQMQGYGAEAMAAVVAEEEQAQAQAQAARMQRVQVNGQHWQGIREMEAAEEAYFSTEDDEEVRLRLPAAIVSYTKTVSSKPSLRICRMVLYFQPPSHWLTIRMMMMTMPWIRKPIPHEPRPRPRPKPKAKAKNPKKHPLHPQHKRRNRLQNDYQRSVAVKKKTKTN